MDKEPQPIVSNERVREISSFLYIQKVHLSDDGLFRCVATNSVGDEKIETILRVRGK